MEQNGLPFNRRVHDLVAGVEAAAGAKHRVVADVLAAVTNRGQRTNLDLSGVGMSEGRADSIVGQQDRLSAPRAVETAMRHRTKGSFNSMCRLSWLDNSRFPLNRLATHKE